MNTVKAYSTSDLNEFCIALRALYVQDPCIVLPNALWKSEERLSHLECSLRSYHGDILDLKAWDPEGLHVFWNKERNVDEQFEDIVTESRFLIIHDDYFKRIDSHGYSLIKPFFRLKHDHKEISSYALSSDFYIGEVDPIGECEKISDLIGKCYRDLHPSPDTVRSWTSHPVFDKGLWIWIMDKD